jgi:hypothetical protein
MPFCVQCGAKLEDGAKYCGECGAKQPDAAAPVNVPPTQEKPAVPQGYTYTPPASGAGQQSSYNYDPAIQSGPNKPKKKNGGAIVFIILAALVVIGVVAYLVAGRGGKTKADDPVLGLYTARKAEVSGTTIGIETMWKNGFSIELKSNGKAALNVDGEKGSAKWTLDGESFTVKGSGVDCSGTLVDGTITLDNVMDSGVTIYLTKDGAALPAASAAEPASSGEPAQSGASKDIVGHFDAVKGRTQGMDIEVSSMWEKGFFIDFLDDGTCSMNVNGIEGSGSWSQNGETVSVNIPGFNMDGSYRDGVLLFEDVYGLGVDLYFTKDGAALPAAFAAAPSSGGEPAPTDEPSSVESWWAGDWYGWWVVVEAGGSYKDEGYLDRGWDACARIDLYDDGTGYIEIWDQDGDDVAWADVKFVDGGSEKGCMMSSSGSFYNHGITQGEWAVDPTDSACGGFDDLICIQGRYEQPSNANNWIRYQIYLRPWGTRWEDIETGDISGMPYDDMMPFNYDSWYLPLIEAGKPMPESFEGLN